MYSADEIQSLSHTAADLQIKSPPVFYIVTGEFPLATHILMLGFIYKRSCPQFTNHLSHELKVKEKRLSRFLTAM